MNFVPPARALLHAARSVRLRPRLAAASLGGVISLAVGGAYLGGAAVQASTVRAQAERLQGAGAEGYTEQAMAAAAGGLDASALAIANRLDPYTSAGAAQRDRQAELLTARLEDVSGQGLRREKLNPAAQPFRLTSALDQSRDLDCLTKAAYYEARGEGAEGMRAVTQVVLNRVRHPAFPSSVCAVVYQGSNRRSGCQFSFTCNGAMRSAVNRSAWNRARDIASRSLSGQVYAAVGNATHFHTTAVSPMWRNSLVRVSQVGDHFFYRFGGRSGSGQAFARNPEPSSAPEAHLIQANLSSSDRAVATAPVPYSAVIASEAKTAAPGPAPVKPSVTIAAPASTKTQAETQTAATVAE